ncbi:aminotransferase class I/II-fold pyridoxal phosphate-dependent enzyme [Streptomyces sp. NPDC047108]|uniref:aminotransferase class I/II-fold pyridoxal phosphate-dependent enzyme n=1 Tax=Streptomyces sp. NPDC047108 TaxID=3155025 RepID=UPI0033D4B578
MSLSDAAGRIFGFRPARADLQETPARPRGEDSDLIDFASGELDFEPPASLRRALAAAPGGPTHRRTGTAGLHELRVALAARVTRTRRVVCAPSQVLVTAGARHGLHLACLALLNQGDDVLVPQPAWGTFMAQIRLVGANPVGLDTRDTGFVPTVEGLEALRTPRTRMIVLNTPNNPTGAVYPPERLAEITEWAVRNDLWILFDECYGDLVLPGAEHTHPVHLVAGARDHVVSFGSFSQSFAVPGWRVGWAYGPERVVSALADLQHHTTSSAGSAVQHGVLPAARGEEDAFLSEIRAVLRHRHGLARGLIAELPHVTAPDPQGAHYFLLDARSLLGRTLYGTRLDTADDLAGALVDHAQVALAPGTAFGAEGRLRLSYGLPDDRIEEGLGRLGEVLAEVE